MSQQELDQLLQKMKDLKDRLVRLAVILDQIQKEIDILEELERQLKENMKELKKQNVIALAHEFKKAKEDLKRTKVRLSFLNIDRQTYLDAHKSQERILNGLGKQYADALKRLQNNVIKGKFGKKDGG